MPPGGSEADRLAQQRRNDLEEVRARDARREYERGKREERDLAHTADQDRVLAELSKDLGDLKKRMGNIEKAFGEFSAVATAIAEKGVSTRTFILGVIAVIVPIVVLFLSSGKVH